jgi:dipeptidyl aminopeptidase/acylaminoacyl peptidase
MEQAIVQDLINEGIVDYEIIDSTWQQNGYQTTAKLLPGERFIVMEVQRLHQRYQVVALDYTAGPQPETAAIAAVNHITLVAPGTPSIEGTLIIQPQTGGDFYLVEDNGSSLRLLTSGIDPALSPDNTQIAFTRWDGAEIGSLWVYDLATGEERIVADNITFQPKSPTWSGDGTKIIINMQHGGSRKEVRKCWGKPPPEKAYDVSFDLTDNGDPKFYFTLPPDPHWSLRLIDVATGSFEDLPSATYSYSPNWDPAQPWRVVFYDTSVGVAQLDLNRGELLVPFFNNSRAHMPVFSPDGSQIAVNFHHDNFWAIYTLNAADGSLNRLGRVAVPGKRHNDVAPAWSPDGKQIVFVTDRTGQWEFWVMNADGSYPRPLLSPNIAQQLKVEFRGMDERLISWGMSSKI